LTTVRIDQYRLGVMTGQLLLERMEDNQPASPAQATFPTELVIRNSCGARRRSSKQTRQILEDLIVAVSVDMSSEDEQFLHQWPGGSPRAT
jgi:hypothetical protein